MTGIENIRIDLSEEEGQTHNADAIGSQMEELEEWIAPANMVEYIILVGVVALLAIAARGLQDHAYHRRQSAPR